MKYLPLLLYVFCVLSISNTTAQTVADSSKAEMPYYKNGGEEGILKFISKNMKYPEEARKKGIEGKVFVSFIVDTFGHTTDVHVVNTKYKLLDEEAVRVVNLLGNWEPGKLGGRKVNVKYNIPILFSLETNKKEEKLASWIGTASGMIVSGALIYFFRKKIFKPYLSKR